MADETQSPVFQIQRIYLKDLSLEQPNSPQILLEQAQPQVDINLGLGAEPIADGVYEVTVTATVTTKVSDKTLFLVEAKQAGIFEIRNIPEDQLQPIVGIACPGIVYPYLRAIVSDVCTRAGFPPVLLAEVNFQAMYEAQQAQQAAAAEPNGAGSIITARTERRHARPGPRRRARMNLTVLGAGAWGTALAVSTAGRHPTRLWARDAAQARAMRSLRAQQALPARGGAAAGAADHLRFRGRARACGRRPADRRDADGRARGDAAAPRARTGRACCGCARASSRAPGARPRGRARRSAASSVGVLSGPSFALEVARGQPTALVAASSDDALCEQAVEALHSDSLRVYTSNDPVGVEVGGAVKNVLAIATGLADGLELGLNARAALITRGLAEMTRLGVALGARVETFMGLSGWATWC